MNQTIQEYLRSGSQDYELYLQICKEQLANNGEDRDDIFHNELLALYLLERYEEVITRYKEVEPLVQSEGRLYNIKGTLQTCLYKRGIELVEAGRDDKAFEYFKESVALEPECEMAHYCLGQHYQNQGDVYRAMHHYYEALKIQPEFPEIYNNLAVIQFHEESDIKAAIAHIETALQQNPSPQLQQKMYISLSRLYKLIAEYDLHEYYRMKLLESIGFPVEYEEGDDEEEGDVEK
jgi:tetratricopeptide (TPR) repeat protein